MNHSPVDFIWMDGTFLPAEEATLHVLTHGLHYASAVFEGARAYDGHVFKLTEHNQRFHASAHILGFEIPYSVSELDEITKALLIKNNLTNAYVRPIAWCDTDYLSVASHRAFVHVAIAAWVWQSYFSVEDLFSQGLKLIWADWVRPAPTMAPVQAKASCLYAIGSLSKNKAELAGFHDALMLDYRGYVAECTGANVFLVKNGVIHTPIADCFLNGITRQTVIELAKKLGFSVMERHIMPEEIAQADELFMTGSAVEVSPIGQVAEQHFAVGPITQTIAAAYKNLVTAPAHSE